MHAGLPAAASHGAGASGHAGGGICLFHVLVLLSCAIIGNGVGPLFTGWLSDLIHLRTGGDGLCHALAVVVSMLVPAMLAFGCALRAYPAARRATPLCTSCSPCHTETHVPEPP